MTDNEPTVMIGRVMMNREVAPGIFLISSQQTSIFCNSTKESAVAAPM